MFIVFEGGDGSGKSTQAQALLQRLQQEGYPSLLTREPGGTPLGEYLRDWLKSSQDATPLAELFLFNSARAQLVSQVIRPSVEQGIIVVSDRFTASTVAYQGFGRGLSLDVVESLNYTATDGLTPGLTVLLDAPPQVGLARLGITPQDTFDAAPLEFHHRVRGGYLHQAQQSPDHWLVLDASRQPDELTEEIWSKIKPLLITGGA